MLAVPCEQAERVREMPPPGCRRDILRPPERLGIQAARLRITSGSTQLTLFNQPWRRNCCAHIYDWLFGVASAGALVHHHVSGQATTA